MGGVTLSGDLYLSVDWEFRLYVGLFFAPKLTYSCHSTGENHFIKYLQHRVCKKTHRVTGEDGIIGYQKRAFLDGSEGFLRVSHPGDCYEAGFRMV